MFVSVRFCGHISNYPLLGLTRHPVISNERRRKSNKERVPGRRLGPVVGPVGGTRDTFERGIKLKVTIAVPIMSRHFVEN